MAPSDWYYAKDNRQLGPVSSTELRQLAENGQLSPDDLVWREGMPEWIPADKVKGLFDALAEEPSRAEAAPAQTTPADDQPDEFSPAPAPTPPLPAGNHLFDILIRLIQRLFPSRFVDSSSKILAACGHWGLYVGMAMLLVFGLVLGPTVGSLTLALVVSAAGILVLIVLQYVSGKFLVALDTLNRNTPGHISSTALPDGLALLSICTGPTLFVVLLIVALPLGSFSIILLAIGLFILSEYMAILALNPDALNIQVKTDASAGAEAVGILTFLAKLVLRLVPVAFGVGITLGICHLIVAGTSVASGPISETVQATVLVTAMLSSANILFIFAALPIAAYLLFLAAYLFIDVLNSILEKRGRESLFRQSGTGNR